MRYKVYSISFRLRVPSTTVMSEKVQSMIHQLIRAMFEQAGHEVYGIQIQECLPRQVRRDN